MFHQFLFFFFQYHSGGGQHGDHNFRTELFDRRTIAGFAYLSQRLIWLCFFDADPQRYSYTIRYLILILTDYPLPGFLSDL